MIVWIIAAVAVLFIVLVFVTGYVKASPDTAYIISGLRKTPKVLIGKAGVKIPFFEKKDELSLQLIPIDVKTSSAVPTADYINIKVDAAVNVKISDTPDLLNLAAQNFLNRKVDYIASVAREVLEGNMREIVGKMELQEMVSDRQKFANLVKENAEPDLAAIGAIDFEGDKSKAIDNDSNVQNQRHSKAVSTAEINQRFRQVDEAEGTAEASITAAYQELQAQLLQYQAALESYAGAELVYQSQKRRQAAGMLSNTEYLQGEADYAESKAAKETASMNLVQAYESYCWEVKGIG